MRIPAVVAAATALTLGLGATVALGFTAAADPPDGWSVVINEPVYDVGPLVFGGTKPAEADIIQITLSGASAESIDITSFCMGLELESTGYDCGYNPEELFYTGEYTYLTFYLADESSFEEAFDIEEYIEPPADGPPSMAYDFTPAGVTATGTPTAPGTKVATQFYKFTDDPYDYWDAAGGCPVPGWDYGTFDNVNGNSCSVTELEPGTYNIYSQQDIGDGITSTDGAEDDDEVSVYFVVPATPTIEGYFYSDDSAQLSGTFPPTFAVDFPEQCGDSLLYNSDGDWSCHTSPLSLGDHTFSIQAYDDGGHSNESITDATYTVGGRSALASVSATIEERVPAVTFDFEPGEIIAGSSVQGSGTVARTDIYEVDPYSEYDTFTWYDSCGGPNPYEDEGYSWDGDRFWGIFAGQEDYGCSFPGLNSGIYIVEAQQDDGTLDEGGAPYPAYESTSHYVVLPETPTIVDVELLEDNRVEISGFAPYGYEVHVVDEEGELVCEPLTPDEIGDWSCTTGVLGVGYHTFYAFSKDDGAGEGALPYWWSAEYVAGGESALSDDESSVAIGLTPGMSYGFIPGGVVAAGVPTPPGTVVDIDLFWWELPDYEEYYEYEGDGFVYAASCGALDHPYWDYDLEVGEGELDSPPFGCVFGAPSPLEAGIWKVSSLQDVGDGTTPAYGWAADDYFVVPATPVISTATATVAGTVVLSGVTVPGNIVHVLNGASELVCDSIPAGEDGDWTCTTPVLGNGTHTFRAYSEDVGAGENTDVPGSVYMAGGLSNYSASKSATLPVASLPGTGATTPPAGPPAPTLLKPTWFFTLAGVDLSNLRPGQTFIIKGSGLPPGSVITAELHSTPVGLGTATVASNGTFSLTATVPEDVEPGDHTVVVTLAGEGLEPTTAEQPVHVTAESEAAGHSAEGSGTAEEAHGEASGASDLHEASVAPNILTNSMNPIIDVLTDPTRIPAAFAAGIVLIIFALLPAHLLNSTIAEQYERLVRRLPQLRTAPRWYTALAAGLTKAPVLGGIALMAATGFLFAFADPHFGFNLHSLRLIIALSAALFVVFFVANGITSAIMRRVWNVDVVVRLRPAGLILTVVGVIISRILEFSPGFLIGIVLGLSIASSAAAEHAWKAVLIRASVVTTFGIASWIVYSSIAPAVHHDPTFLNEVILEFFVAIATEGIVLLLVELLPLHMLEGERLYKKSRLLWAAVYAVVVTVFILAVVPWEGNWRELGESFWPWFTTVAIFGAVCVAIYLFFRFIAPPLHHEGHDAGEPEHEDEDDERIAVGNDS